MFGNPLHDDRERDCQQKARREALRETQSGNRLHTRGERGTHAGDGKQCAPEDERVPGAEAVDHRAADRQTNGEGCRVTPDDEGVAVETAQVACGARQRGRNEQHV